MTQLQLFGGDWTDEKLARVREYLNAYTRALKNQPFQKIYIDAFAGTGYRYRKLKQHRKPSELMFPELAEEETQKFLQGSAQIALETEPRFDRFIFIERAKGRFRELHKLPARYPALAPDIQLVNADCNEFLQHLCYNGDWKGNRAVLFLDPFGMQVEWKTIEAIADTEAIDLWVLFPLGVAVNRLLPRHARINEPMRKSLDTLFGTRDWFDEFYQPKIEQTLFGEEAHLEKRVNLDQIGQYFVNRLKTVFTRVAENPLPLYNSRNIPLYLLCFAAGNPRGSAIAVKIAQHILSKRGPYGTVHD